MKFILSLQQWILNEQALDRSENIKVIKSMKFTLNEHLFKYYLMPDSIYREHWLTEIKTSFLGKISEYVWNNKPFTAEKYYEMLFLDYISEKNYKNMFKQISNKYHTEHQIEYDITDFENRCSIFYTKICSDLSKKQYKGENLSEIIKVFDI